MSRMDTWRTLDAGVEFLIVIEIFGVAWSSLVLSNGMNRDDYVKFFCVRISKGERASVRRDCWLHIFGSGLSRIGGIVRGRMLIPRRKKWFLWV